MTREEAIVQVFDNLRLKSGGRVAGRWTGAHIYWMANGEWEWHGHDRNFVTITRANCVGLHDTVTEADYHEALAIVAGAKA